MKTEIKFKKIWKAMCEQSEKFNKEIKVIKKKVPNRNSATEEFNE